MRFLVTTESVEMGPVMQPQQSLQIVERLVIPSLQMLAQWEQEGKIRGGGILGERAGAFVLDVDSMEEAQQMLGSLPFWGINTWTVRPLVSTQSTLAQAQQQVQKMKGMTQ